MTHTGFTIWFTGMSGAGKSTLSHALIARLREAGVSIAIDDFGTGHSSLRMLAGLPIDVLKIDRSFVQDLPTNRNHRLIVQTTIGLAASLGLKTVAEGVETLEQHEVLRELGCGAVQGYLISRPAGAPEIAKWLATKRSSTSLPQPQVEQRSQSGAEPGESPRRASSRQTKRS